MGEQKYRGQEAHGGGFRGVYSVAGVRYRTATYPTKGAADKARSAALEAARNGVHVDPRRASLSLDGWFALWAPQRRVRACTAYGDKVRWEKHISPYLGRRALAALTPFQVQSWLKWMQDSGRSDATQLKAYVLLKTALGARGAIADRRITVNPCDAVPRPRHEKPAMVLLSKEDFARILAALPEDQRVVALLGAYCGLRWSEIAGLQRQDFNPLKETLTVQRGLVRTVGSGNAINPPKSGKPRTIPLLPALIAALNVCAEGKAPEDFLLTTETGRPLNGSNWRFKVWVPALERCGLKDQVHFHLLRHANASWLLQGGADIGTVQELMGHASITTTQIYLHSSEDIKRAAVLKALG